AWNNALAIQGRVLQPTRDGNTLNARVQGTMLYDVEITVNDARVVGDCTCPYYESYGMCKHIAAVLVRWFRAPHTFGPGSGAAKTAVNIPPLAVNPAPEPDTRYTSPAWLECSPAEMEQQDAANRLAEHLSDMTVATLREIAAGRQWTLRATLKAAIIEQFAAYMTDSQEIHAALSSLSESEYTILALTAVAGNHTPVGVSGRLSEMLTDLGKPLQRQKVQRTLLQLANAPLIISSQLGKDPSYEEVFVPQALWPHLPALLERLIPGADDLPDTTSAASMYYSQPRRMVDAALQMLLSIDHLPPERAPRTPRPVIENELKWLRDWEYDPEELARLEASGKLRRDQQLMLTTPPPPRSLTAEHIERFVAFFHNDWSVDFLFSLLETAGLVRPGNPVRVDERAKRAFFQQQPAVQLAILFDAYTNMLSWQEMWEVLRAAPQLKLMHSARSSQYSVDATQAGVQQKMTRLRNFFLQTLAWLPEDRWIPVESVIKLLVRLTPTFDQTWPHQSSYYGYAQNWHFTWEGKKPGVAPEDWSRVQGAAMGAILLGPLSWFGLVDLRVTGSDVTHFRLHGLAFLYRQSAPAVEIDRPIPVASAMPAPVADLPVIEGDTIRLNRLVGDAAMLLEKIAQPRSIALNNIVYQLDVTRVHRAFEAGATVALLVAEWNACFGSAMPESLHARLQAWWDGYGSLRIYQKLTLIEFGDDHALREMRAVSALDEVLLVELSPHAVLIPSSAIDRLMAALQRAGYTPKLTDGAE
ncbi:MAG: SWIM zinc finger family protein, partial [Caldilinea sp.]